MADLSRKLSIHHKSHEGKNTKRCEKCRSNFQERSWQKGRLQDTVQRDNPYCP